MAHSKSQVFLVQHKLSCKPDKKGHRREIPQSPVISLRIFLNSADPNVCASKLPTLPLDLTVNRQLPPQAKKAPIGLLFFFFFSDGTRHRQYVTSGEVTKIVCQCVTSSLTRAL